MCNRSMQIGFLTSSVVKKRVLVPSQLRRGGSSGSARAGPAFSRDYNVLVMEMLGPCLEDLLQECHGTFSVSL